MQAESAGDPHAVSRAGAMGLMQIMPGTWAALRQEHSLGFDPFEARDNILAGTAYLRAMLDRYGTVGGMLAAYNAGPGRYDAYLSEGRPMPNEPAPMSRCWPRAWTARRRYRTAQPSLIGARRRCSLTDRLRIHHKLAAARMQIERPAKRVQSAPIPAFFVVRPGVETRP